MLTCPGCNGKKQSFVHLNYGGGRGEWKWVNCWRCDGAGLISEEAIARIERGRAIRDDRKSRLKTLDEESAELGCGLVELSQVENGRADAALFEKVEGLRARRKESSPQ